MLFSMNKCTKDNKRSISTVRSPSTARRFCQPITSLRPGSGKKTGTAPLVGQWRVLHLATSCNRDNGHFGWDADYPKVWTRYTIWWYAISHSYTYYQVNHIIFLLTKLQGFRTQVRLRTAAHHTLWKHECYVFKKEERALVSQRSRW